MWLFGFRHGIERQAFYVFNPDIDWTQRTGHFHGVDQGGRAFDRHFDPFGRGGDDSLLQSELAGMAVHPRDEAVGAETAAHDEFLCLVDLGQRRFSERVVARLPKAFGQIMQSRRTRPALARTIRSGAEGIGAPT